MQEQPIDKAELDQLAQQMRTACGTLTGWIGVVTALNLADLLAHHDDWLKLYQLGQQVSHFAERLDSLYQDQFAVPATAPAELGEMSQANAQPATDSGRFAQKRQQAVDWLEDMFGNITRPRGFTRDMSDEEIFGEMARCRLEWIARDGSGFWLDHERAFVQAYEAWYRDYEFDLVDNLGPAPQPETYLDWARRESFSNHRYVDPDNDFFWWL